MSYRRIAVAVAGIAAVVISGIITSPLSAAGESVVINELAHSPASGPDWLELHNTTSVGVDVSGWTVDGVDAVLPAATSIAPNGFLILARDVPAFQAEFPGVPPAIIFEMGGGLSGGGELLELSDSTDTVVDSVNYLSVAPWPSEPSAGDVTLSLFDPTTNNSLAASWGISAATGGTPGAANDTVPGTTETPPLVIINEIHYNPEDADGDTEFVELFNADTDVTDISGWDLDGLITFPASTTIPAGGYLVVTENLAAFELRYPGVGPVIEWTDGGLSNSGENVRLENSTGVRVDEVEYEDGGDWPTEPDGTGPSLELIDPNLDNTDAASWQVSQPGGTPGAANPEPPLLCNSLVVDIDIAAGDLPTAGDDVILGTPSADVINGLGGNDTICGEGGDDQLTGGPGDDTIFGGDGADLISGQGGADDLFGDDGIDRLNGGAGDDELFGGDGDDDLRGQGGDDELFGEAGVDQFFAGSGADEIHTGDGGNAGTAQIVQGQGGPDTIFGSPQDDVLDGSQGQDEIHGGAGNDILNGGRSSDTLYGDAGDDQLFGGPDRDTLDGGAGTDDCNGGGHTNDTATATCETTILVP